MKCPECKGDGGEWVQVANGLIFIRCSKCDARGEVPDESEVTSE